MSDFSRRACVLANTAEAIGLTPMVDLSRLTKQAGVKGRIIAKLDHLNPGFSKKDRVALQAIRDAESEGLLKPGQTVVELTSGNLGTGLAIVCQALGYPFVAVMSKGNSRERVMMIEAFGGKVILADQAPGGVPGKVTRTDLDLAGEVAEKVTQDLGAFRVDQWHRRSNTRAHYFGTGAEIWEQSGGELTAFCDFVGSGGTLGGVTAYLKEKNPDIRCYAVEPEDAQVLAGKDVQSLSHPIQGGGYARTGLDHLKDITLDGTVAVTGDEAKEGARLLARYEGIFAGFSAGANAMAALKLLQDKEAGGTIAIVICDSGLKYLSTDLWS